MEVIKNYLLLFTFFTFGPLLILTSGSFLNDPKFDSRIYGRIGNHIGERIWDDIDGKPYNFFKDFINYKKK